MELNRVLKRCVAVITGGTSGIGLAAAQALSERGFDLVLLGRNCRRGGSAAARLARRRPEGRFRFVPCDLSNQAEVRRAAREIGGTYPCLDVLINNAGARYDTYQENGDGFELTFATNHLGHFLLTRLLMDSLQNSDQARVITVSSRAHRAAIHGAPWLVTREGYDRRQAYEKSKLANLLFAFELARQLQPTPVVSNALDPGVLATRFARNNGWWAWARHVLPHWVRGELTAARDAGNAIADLATKPGLAEVTGRLFCHGKETEASPAAQDREAAARLWEDSLRWTRGSF